MTTVPRLIEVALPIHEISAESVRDKSLRHGHISTLHLWFARRPLAASRAVVFASLVPDPDHPECPLAFREAVERHLKTHVPDVLKSYRRGRITHLDPDPYRPYEGQPDTLRNRLLAFIAKWSPEWLVFEQGKSQTEPDPDTMLDDRRSLVKWETSSPTMQTGMRKGMPVIVTNWQGRKVLWIARELTRTANNGKPPVVLDPFAGGGSIPLEISRLGGQPIANDYNPVASLILWATCEFPQRHGVAGHRPASHVSSPSKGLFKTDDLVEVPNLLSHDVEHYAQEILRRAKEQLARLYPVGSDKRPVLGYIWARTAPCSNLSCQAEMPLVNSLLICNKPKKKVALTLTVRGKEVVFGLIREKAITRTEGTMLNRGNCRCPVCQQLYGVSEQPWDDVRLVVQLGGEAENAMEVATGRGLFVVNGANSRLAVLADRADRAHLGKDRTDPLIDQLHKAMLLWKAEDRARLVQYLHGHDLGDHVGFWRLAQALFEVMPRDAEDWRLVSALLGERNTLRTEIKRREAALTSRKAGLFDGQEE